jgi:hypothetical protein
VKKHLTRHLVWTSPAPLLEAEAIGLAPAAAPRTKLTTAAARPAKQELDLDLFIAPRDRAIYLLHIGAEVEHALMAQYLYAAYSLGRAIY